MIWLRSIVLGLLMVVGLLGMAAAVIDMTRAFMAGIGTPGKGVACCTPRH